MPHGLREELKQTRPFPRRSAEAAVSVMRTAAILEHELNDVLKPSGLTVTQYNVLRILRGSDPTRLTCSDIGERMIARDPDVTRVVDRLTARRLVARVRSTRDRRVVEVGITEAGLALLRDLDVHVRRMPKALLGHLGPARLRQLRTLLEAVIADVGTFP